MRLFIVFDPPFRVWPVAALNRLVSRVPDTVFTGLANLVYREHNLWILNNAKVENEGIEILDDLERDWLNEPHNGATSDHYEKILGPGSLREILIADRQLGRGFVSGCRFTEHLLTRAGRNPELVRRYVGGLLDWCFKRLETFRPDLVLMLGVDNAPKVALSKTSRYLKIPCYALQPARLEDRQIFDDSGRGLIWPARRAAEAGGIDLDQRYRDKARLFVEQFREQPEAPAYEKANREYRTGWASRLFQDPSAKSKWLSSLVFRRGERLRGYLPVNYALHRLRLIANRVRLERSGVFESMKDGRQRPFAYFPLHVQPEASTMVFSPHMTNQAQAIEALAKSLPLGMDLIVKEHPSMTGGRTLDFYRRVKSLPTVRLISPFENSFRLIERAALTCVITGTAGWEALLLGKPVLTMAETFYSHLGGAAVVCSDPARLPHAVHDAMRRPPVDEETLIAYVAALLVESFHMSAHLLWQRLSDDVADSGPDRVDALADQIIRLYSRGYLGEPHEARSAQSALP